MKPIKTPTATLILGVDPGTRHTGYGLLKSGGQSLELVTQGRLTPSPSWSLARRLAHIHQGLSEILQGYRPPAVAVEDIFYGKNVRSALILGHVRGVVLLAAAQAEAEIFEYAPRLVKNTVAGYGQAEKEQVAHMVAELLSFKEPLAADAADALAVAICHASQCRMGSLVKKAGGGGRKGWRGMTEEDLAAMSFQGR